MLGYVQTESEVRADYIGLSQQLKSYWIAAYKTSPAALVAALTVRSPFDGQLQPFQDVIPLRANDFQGAPRLLDLSGFERPNVW
jgi:hypothetical protein